MSKADQLPSDRQQNVFRPSSNDAVERPTRLLFVNLDFPPVTGPGIWRVLAFVKYAAQEGHQVHVICSERSSWHRRSDESLLSQIPPSVIVKRLNSRFMHEVLDSIKQRENRSQNAVVRKIWAALHWRVESYYPDFAADWGIRAAIIALLNVRSWNPTCVITTGPQHASHLTGLVLKKLAGVPWVMDYRDPWTGNPTQGQFPTGPYQLRLHEWLERKCVANADVVTVVTPWWRSWLAHRFADIKPDSRFILLRNGHDLSSQPTDANRPPHTRGRLLMHFNGVLQTGNDVSENLLKALARLRSRSAHDDLPLVSFCGMPPRTKDCAHDLGIEDHVIDFGPMPYDRALATCVGADVLLILVKTGDDLQRGVIPGKIYEAIALGKPIFAIVPAENDVRDLLSEYPIATLAEDNVESILDAIERLMIAFRSHAHGLGNLSPDEKGRFFSMHKRSGRTQDLLRIIRSLGTNGDSAHGPDDSRHPAQ